MVRLLLGTTDAPAAGADDLVRAGRGLRDAGHEVVHAPAGLDGAALALAAVQEDVEVVLVITRRVRADADSAPDSSADPSAAVRERLAAAGADDVRVLVVGPDDVAADLLTRLGAGPGN